MSHHVRIRHPAWGWARHLALPMLLCWTATAFALSNGSGIRRAYSWPMVVLSLGLLVLYVCAAIINYRFVLRVLGRGQCLDCQYELWPTIEAGHWECPECGRAISSSMAEQVMKLREVERHAEGR